MSKVTHGMRVEERQKVNHQPNGYAPISERELENEKLKALRREAVLHPDPEVSRELAARLAAA